MTEKFSKITSINNRYKKEDMVYILDSIFKNNCLGELVLDLNESVLTDHHYPNTWEDHKNGKTYVSFEEKEDLSDSDFSEAPFRKGIFCKTYLLNTNFTSADLIEADFSEAKAFGTKFLDAYLMNAKFYETDLERADFRGANLEGATLNGANLNCSIYDENTIWPNMPKDVSENDDNEDYFKISSNEDYNRLITNSEFKGKPLGPYAVLNGEVFSNVDLSEIDLRYANFTRATFDDCNFIKSNCTGANFSGADLYGANVTGANLAGTIYDENTFWPNSFLLTSFTDDEDYYKISSNEDYDRVINNLGFKGKPIGPYAVFRKANFSGKFFDGISLKGGIFVETDFSKTNFKDANFQDTNFMGSNFQGAYCVGANFSGADLRYTNLEDTIIDDGEGNEYVLVGNSKGK